MESRFKFRVGLETIQSVYRVLGKLRTVKEDLTGLEEGLNLAKEPGLEVADPGSAIDGTSIAAVSNSLTINDAVDGDSESAACWEKMDARGSESRTGGGGGLPIALPAKMSDASGQGGAGAKES